MSEGNMEKVGLYLPVHHKDKLRELSFYRETPMSRLVALLVDKEFKKDKPFDGLDIVVPDDEVEEFAYADEAGKILAFLGKQRKGAGLDILYLLRFKIGIEDKYKFLMGFKDCLDRGLIEAYKAPKKLNAPAAPEGYFNYRLKGEAPTEKKKAKKKATEYERWEKLNKKFGKEKDL